MKNKIMWEIRYFDKNLGRSVRYMNMAFKTKESAEREEGRIIRDKKTRIFTHRNKTHIRVKPIKITEQ